METKTSPSFILHQDAHVFPVARFSLQNWGISREYVLQLELQNPDAFPELLNKVYLQVEGHYFHGYVTSIQESLSDGCHEVKLTVVSPLTYFLQSIHTCIFSQYSLQELIQALLAKNGMMQGIDFQLQFNNGHTDIWLQQDNQSSLEFLLQCCKMYGLFYYYQQDEYGCCCIFTDSLTSIEPKETSVFSFSESTGLNQKNELKLKMLEAHVGSKAIEGREYDAYSAYCNSKEKHSNYAYAYGKQTITDKNAITSSLVQRALEESMQQLCVQSHSILAQPGQSVSFANTFLTTKQLQVCSISLFGEAPLAQGAKSVSHQDKLHRSRLSVEFFLSPAFCGLPDKDLSKPCSKLQTATIEHRPGPYPDLSENGEYHLRMHVDEKQNNRGVKSKASLKVRAALYYAGAHYGMSLPYSDGSEVLVGFENGHAQKPIIMGSLSNQNNPQMVQGSKQSEYLLRSQSGHYLKCCEDNQTTIMELSTQNQVNRFFLQQGSEGDEFKIESQQGSIDITALTTVRVISQEQYQQKSQYSQSFWLDGFFKLHMNEGNLYVLSEGSIGLNMKKNAAYNGQTHHWYAHKKMQLKASSTATFMAQRALTFNCEQGSLTCQAIKGNIIFKAKSSITVIGGSAKLKFTKAALQIQSPSPILIKSACVLGLEPLEATA